MSIEDLRPFNIDDLLGRSAINANRKLLIESINNKNIMVTGAGGSIGSEICKQVLKFKPKRLILVDSNEYSLYTIYNNLISKNKDKLIFPILSNLQNSLHIENLLVQYEINSVYHAAAYKHVKLVEENIIESVKNNVFCTYNLIRSC